MLALVSGVLALVAGSAAATSCDPAGDWLIPNNNNLQGKFYPIVDTGAGKFNLTMDIRHGPGVVQGTTTANGISVSFDGKTQSTATFTPNCSQLLWNASNRHNFGTMWCRGWQPGCNVIPPPYGRGLQFNGVFGSNMVLQRGPQKSAVYGVIAMGASGSEKPNVTVTVDNNAGKVYTLQTTLNSTTQPFGPGWEWPWPWKGPFQTWKALLPPTPAGGNYTIIAECSNCMNLDSEFVRTNITNVTFGDVIYCSGQSNMWLPLFNTFSRNETLRNITQAGKYRNIRIMAGNSGAQGSNYAGSQFNPWMTSLQAANVPSEGNEPLLFQFGAACWYTAQKLSDLLEASNQLVPLGLADTAIGGQRIEEYSVNTTLVKCSERAGENIPQWDGVLYGKMVVPFVDMTVKMFLWYQGENNMGATKGNAIANVGYGCEMATLVSSWRAAWSKVPGTTDPMAPFGIVTLASSGSEGGPDMGAMRWAQTGNFGVLPGPTIPNSFVGQAYDLDDPWGPTAGPCINTWKCCNFSGFHDHVTYNETACNIGTNNNRQLCDLACAAANDTPYKMGGIHPRDKKPLGDRLGVAAFNTVYGGKDAFTGPTLAGCTLSSNSLTVQFNTTLLRGDTVVIQPYNQSLNMSYLEVQTDPTIFCVEVQQVNSSCRGQCAKMCPSWAGGSSVTNNSALTNSDQGWQPLNISLSSPSTISVDLTPLGGKAPTAIRYAWGLSECCNKQDPDLYVKYPCGPAPCPIMSSTKIFPANPFIAKIESGKCKCIAPQVCDA